MTATTAAVMADSAPQVLIETRFGWCRAECDRATVWLNGYIVGQSAASIAAAVAGWRGAADEAALQAWLRSLDGHFALVAATPDWTLAAADRVRSIPLAYARAGDGWAIGGGVADVRACAGLGPADVRREAALAIAMAGYAIGADTLHHGLEQTGPGEAALFRTTDGTVTRLRYHAWQPWQVEPDDPVRLEHRLRETTLAILEKQVASLDGRPIAVPLSAGYDSRLIVSGLRHLGVRDVICFSYGLPGGHEAETARQVAERLGYRWRFTPTGRRRLSHYFESLEWEEFRRFSDDDTAIPFVQDMTAILDLGEAGYLPADCAFMNGNSGDFISGMHIPPGLRTRPADLDQEARRVRIVDSLSGKHFALWEHLRTPANLQVIGERVWAAIEAAGGKLGDTGSDHGLYERAEFQDRQSKYVIKGQRTYEFLGHDWRLPLWDKDYLDFWERVPLAEKAGQALYARMLRNADWGGVWADVPVNRRRIRPRWMIPFRLAAKAAYAPLGRTRWHRFERRVFSYWLDTLGTAALVPYARVLTDRRGARNAMAWLAEDFLASNGVPLSKLAGD